MSNTDGTAVRVRWSRIGLLLVVVLVVLELLARLAISQALGQPFRSFDAYSFSGFGVYRQNPRYTHPRFVHNSVGFRTDREYSIDKPANTLRIMAIGASVLYAGSAITRGGASTRVGSDETITAYLEPLIREMPELAGRNVEVINTGVNRHHFRHVLSYYVAELARYDPDIVIVFGSNNDARFLEFGDGFEEMFHDPAAPLPEEARLELLANESSLRALAEKAVRVGANRSALVASTFRIVDRGLKQVSSRAQARRRTGAEPRRELGRPEQIDRNLRYFLATLDGLLAYIRTQGARPIVFWEYSLLTVEDIKPLSDYERDVAAFLAEHTGGFTDEQKRVKREIRERVAEHLAAERVPLIDILEDLRGYPGDVYNDYLHYSAEGNRWVAGLIARELRPLVREWAASDSR